MRTLLLMMVALLWTSNAGADAAPGPDDDADSECTVETAGDDCEECESSDDTPTLCEEQYSGTDYEYACDLEVTEGVVEIWCDEGASSGGGGCAYTASTASPLAALAVSVGGIVLGLFLLRRRD